MIDLVTSKETQIKRIHDTSMLLMRLSRRWFLQRLQGYGLTLPQYVALSALAAHREPCTMRDLTNVTIQDPPTMTGVIDRLVKTGLVQRTRSEQDRRLVLVQASQEAIDLVNQIEDVFTQEALESYAKLGDEDLAAFEQVLRKLLQIHLDDYMDTPAVDLDAEMERLEAFVKDPIFYVKLEREKAQGVLS